MSGSVLSYAASTIATGERSLREIAPHPTDALIPAAIAEAESALRPADPKLVGVWLIRLARALMLELPEEAVLADHIKALCRAVPEDLVGQAAQRLMETYRYNTPPKPADWAHAVKDEVERRRQVLGDLRRHKDKLELVARLYR